MPDPTLHHVLHLAAAQHGAISSEQVFLQGGSPPRLQAWLRSGRLVRRSPRVLLVPGAPDSPERAAMIAVLDAGPGAVLSHHSAAALWGLPGFDLEPHHVLAPRTGLRREDRPHTLHISRRIRADHVAVLDGIPTTTPTRLPFDLAATTRPERIERVVDTLWSRRLTTGRLLHDMLGELACRGRSGITTMRAVLAERGPDYRPPESGLEARAMQILTEAGITGFERQVDLGDDTRWLARVDLVHPRHRQVLEIDSDRYHSALLDVAADATRTERLVAAGYEVTRVLEFDVWHQPWKVIDAARSAIARSWARTGADG